MKIKKQLLTRQCISCRRQLQRGDFYRLTKTSEQVFLNPNKYQLGRSAYLCKSGSCINIAIKGKKIQKMLRTSDKMVEVVSYQLSIIGKENSLNLRTHVPGHLRTKKQEEALV